MGEQGTSQQKSNFRNTCTFFNRVLGHKGIVSEQPNEQLASELKWMTTKMAVNNDMVAYEV